jgi:hypothetical protein
VTVALEGAVVRLVGDCMLEDAPTLAALLAEARAETVDVSSCRSLHGAVLQVLLTFRPAAQGTFADAFLREWIGPGLRGLNLRG